MKRSWDLKPNLLDCILEDRIAPAIANLGVIVLTTSGLSLVTPFPGAVNAGAIGGASSSNAAASVSGAAIPTSFYVTGSRGISTFQPGNFTGNPNIGGVAGAAGGVGLTIQVGSGADEDGGPSPASSRTAPGQGPNAPIMAYIGQVGTGSGAGTPDSATGQSQTSQTTAPVPSLPSLGTTIPGSPAGSSPGASSPTNPMSPQLGAPTLMQGLGGKLVPSLPGGLGIQGGLMPSSGPGGF
jgi:hypothetical protein